MFKLYVPMTEIIPTMCDPFKGFSAPDQTVGIMDDKGKIPNPQLIFRKADAKTEGKGDGLKHFFEIDDATAWKIAAHLPKECTLVMVKK